MELDNNPEEARNWKEIIPDRSRSPFDVASDHEQHVMIEAALDKINPIFREAVVLRELEGLSYKEVAAVTGVPIGTVMSRLSRGRGLLRQAMAGRRPDPS